MFTGSMTAMITPFRNGKVDEKALGDLIEFQISGGTDGIVPCGTTGESATLSYEEHERVVEFTIEAVNRRVPVIAGAGSNSTDETIMLTAHAKKAGADAALLITPYYNKPSQEGLYLHYRKVAEEVDIPLVLYNVPGRTGLNMLPSTVGRLARMKNVVGIKEASGNLQQISEIIELCSPEFSVVSGDDFTVLPTLAIGGKGVISVVSNVVPADMAALCDAWFAGDITGARKLHYRLQPLSTAMFYETNPIPVKTALALMGRCELEFRLPLCPLSDGNAQKLKSVMQGYGLLEATGVTC